MNENERHMLEYVILIVGFLSFGILIFLFRHNYSILVLILLFLSVFYTLWGIIHHALEGRLTKTIAAEYIGFSIFVLLLLMSVVGM